MARSLKKGPFVDHHLIKKVETGGQQQRSRSRPGRVARWSCRKWSASRSPSITASNHIPVLVNENMVGHKLGEFALTRTFKGHGGDKKAGK